MLNKQFLFSNLNHFIALGFGSGLFKRGPGTAGSLVAIPVFFLIINFNIFLQWLFILTLFFVGMHTANITSQNLKIKDPSCIVIDEIVALVMLFLLIPQSMTNFVLAFIFFVFLIYSNLIQSHGQKKNFNTVSA